jgi:D-inositol-3-phosphate glycosyltransferase
MAIAARRIALVSEHASPLAAVGEADAGGQNVHVAALAIELARGGAEVVVHTRRDDPDLPDEVPLAPGVTVAHVDAGPPEPLPKDALLPHMARFATELERAWTARRPDVVHAHFWMSGLAAATAAEPLGLPLAQTFHALGVVKRRHQGGDDTSPADRLAIERWILGRADRVVATCRDEVRELLAMGLHPTRVAVVPCGVDLALFWHDGPAEPRPGPRHRLLLVGRLVPRKGFGDALTALAELPDAELVIAGGPEHGQLDADEGARQILAQARALGLADRVELRGQVARADLPALYRSADLVLVPPWYEPFGIVPLEAMGCGVPVVASAVGGLLDTVVDGTTGVLVPPRRPDLLAAAVRELLADPRRRARMGRAASRRARLYSWPRVAAATQRVYDELVSQSALGQAVSQ